MNVAETNQRRRLDYYRTLAIGFLTLILLVKQPTNEHTKGSENQIDGLFVILFGNYLKIYTTYISPASENALVFLLIY